MQVYFYPHSYLRDRQLDTIYRWPRTQVVNLDDIKDRSGGQVSAKYANAKKLGMSWKQKLPLLNLKLRPKILSNEVVVYVWGAIVATGNFIVDLDNPWSLVGYNLRAMPIYRWFIKRALLSDRCQEIRCMSEACRKSLRVLFGEKVYSKAQVHYPCVPQVVSSVEEHVSDVCRFLFVGTQFEIKGGDALIKAFRRVYERRGNCTLDAITHLPNKFDGFVKGCEGIQVYDARFTRDEVHTRFMLNADVLVLPTYVESFGMVALEALAHGLAIISTDVYALGEIVRDGVNGALLAPPISVWDGVKPSSAYYDLPNIKKRIRSTDTTEFEIKLENAIEYFLVDPVWRLDARQASTKLMRERFLC